MRNILTSILILTFSFSYAQIEINGEVKDAETGELLVFVAVVIGDGNKGTTSDIDGGYKFNVNSSETPISFRYVGYRTLNTTVATLQQNPVVNLLPDTQVLKEVTILAGENPAHPIIRKVVARKSDFNPSKMEAYSFDSYNKFIVGSDIIPEIDETDSAQIEYRDMLRDNYFFSMESVTKRAYERPNKVNETVLANRVSGFKTPQFTTLASSFQNIGFYDDYIKVFDIPFLNPISKNSFDNYYFELVDSLIDQSGRKNYIISFEPRKTTFNGLKGVLQIDSDEFAIRNVIAETIEFTDLHQQLQRGESELSEKANLVYMMEVYLKVNFRIQQNYQRITKDVWFPDQLKADIFLGEIVRKNSPAFPVMGMAKSYLRNIQIGKKTDAKFSRTILSYDRGAFKKDSLFWNEYREKPLTIKEQRTYELIDSTFEAAKVEKILAIASGLIEKRIESGGPVDINLHKAFDFNRYEGFRAGLGLVTSKKLSRFFELGGYWAYGFKDKADKYGGHLKLKLLPENRLTIFGRYANDLRQFGAVNFYKYKSLPLASENFYGFLIDNMYPVTEKEVGINLYWLRYLDTKISLHQSEVTAIDEYRFIDDVSDPVGQEQFNFTELKVQVGYNSGINYVQALNRLIETTRSDFYLGVNYARGITSWDGEFVYNKYEFMLQKRFLTRSLGWPTFTVRSGYVDEAIPAYNLFNINGTEEASIDVQNSFRTMGINEFVADRYISVFYDHYLFQVELHPKYSKPQFHLTGGVAYGEFNNADQHLGRDFMAPDQTYYEAGVLVRRLLRVWGYSFGFGVYNRFGQYASSDWQNNIAIKFDFGIDTGE